MRSIMTIGIYALYWAEQDLIYIGQSRDVYVRIRRHFSDLAKNGHCNKKLQQAYNNFGLPEKHLLCECSADKLESNERYYISEFDSVNNGLNNTHGSGSNSGTEHASAKYSKIQVLKVFSLLAKSNLSYETIADRVNVHKTLVLTIRKHSGHFWLKDKWPKLWNSIPNRVSTSDKTTCVSLVSPEGIEYLDVQISKFVSENINLFGKRDLRQVCNGFYKLTTGVRKSYLGWKLK